MSGHIAWLVKPSEAWKGLTIKEQRLEDTFNRNITSTEPPEPIPVRKADVPTEPHRPAPRAPSYSQPTAASTAAAQQAVKEMQGHLARRGKRLTQLFLHADRDRSGTLDSNEVSALLKTANIPEALTQQFMQQLDNNQDGQVSLDEFSRALADNGYSGARDTAPKIGKIDKRMWASRAFIQQEEELAQLALKSPTNAQLRRNRGATRNANRKHGAWDYRDPPRPADLEINTAEEFHSKPYYTSDRQVHAWRSYHVQPNPVAVNRAHPAYPPYGELMQTNYAVSHEREATDGAAPARQKHRPQSAVTQPPASRRPAPPPRPRPASAVATTATHKRAHARPFADMDQFNDKRVGFRNVFTGFEGQSQTHVIPNATLWTCQLARRQITTPPGIHAHARTSQERNFAKEPSAGMKWNRDQGWHVTPQRPTVDERFVIKSR